MSLTRPIEASTTSRVTSNVSRTPLGFFHGQLDADISDPVGDDRVATSRDYFRMVRGWRDEAIAEKLLGWAPSDSDTLRGQLQALGYSRKEMLANGLFYRDLTPHFVGRYVFPYFDRDGRPVYAISRSIDAADDGHPADRHGNQKYNNPTIVGNLRQAGSHRFLYH